MAFLALASQKSLLALQKNFLQFQLLSIMNQTNMATSQMAAIEREYSAQEEDCTTNADFIYYENLSEQLESQKDSIESQITALENEISGLKTMVNNNIKSSCTLNLLGS